MNIDREQMEIARKADPITIVKSLGYTVRRRSGSEYNLVEHDSLMINPEKGWYWNSRDVGGKSTVDLVMALEGIDQPIEAGKLILDSLGHLDIKTSKIVVSRGSDISDSYRRREFVLPEKNQTQRHVIAYLMKTRGISGYVVQLCLKEGILYEAKGTQNAVFVGRDPEGIPRYAFERGTNYDNRFVREAPGSRKEYGFKIEGVSDSIHVFESAIDALSYMSILSLLGRRMEDTLVALSGSSTKALDRYMEDHLGKIHQIYVRTDNDTTGNRIYKRISENYKDRCGVHYALPENYKDYNDVLFAVKSEKGINPEEVMNMIRTRSPDEISREGPEKNKLEKPLTEIQKQIKNECERE